MAEALQAAVRHCDCNHLRHVRLFVLRAEPFNSVNTTDCGMWVVDRHWYAGQRNAHAPPGRPRTYPHECFVADCVAVAAMNNPTKQPCGGKKMTIRSSKLLRLFQNEFKGQLWEETEAAVERKRETQHSYAHYAVVHQWTVYGCNMVSLNGDAFRLDIPKSVWDRIRVGDTLPVMYRVSHFDANKCEWKLDSERITFKLVVKH
jgi:hypothetical protein